MNKKKAAPFSQGQGVQGDTVGVHAQVRRSSQAAIKMIAPSMIMTNNAAVESPCHGAGVGEWHQFGAAVTADIIKGGDGAVLTADDDDRLVL